jgi:Domain of unknown function (DUF4349)
MKCPDFLNLKKKSQKMKLYPFVLLSIFIISTLSCGDRSENKTAGQEADYHVAENASDTAGSPVPPPPGNEGVTVERKLIKDGTIEYKTDNLNVARKQLIQATARWKGYVASEAEYNAEDRNSTTLVIRVPAANFDSLLAAASLGIAHFDRKDIQVMDVTAEYVDIEARLKTKKDLELRYMELLKKANTVTEMLEIEREMGDLRSDIESIEGRLNVMKNQVAFSTLTVTIYETVSAPSFFGDRIGSGFVSGWNNLLDFMVFVINLWPFLLLGVAGYWGIKKWRARKRVK